MRWWLVVLGLAGLGCQQDYTFVSYSDPNLGVEARLIELDPPVLDFGQVEPYTQATADVTVRNIGRSTLYLREVEVEGYLTFAAQSPEVNLLEPGEETLLHVTYAPAGFERATASLVVHSSDPILPEATAGLAGRSNPPSIKLTPTAFDFGQEFIGCALSHRIEISNVGEGDLLIREIGVSTTSGEFRVSLDPPVTLPMTLSPGALHEVVLDYVPSDEGEDNAAVVVRSNDPERPEAEALAYGAGRSEGHVTDRFDQVANNQTDILFVVDNSYSMNEEQETLICNFQSFLDIVDALEIDYQIGVITTDSPILQGEEKVITPESIDPTGTFEANAMVGVEGFGQETGLEMAKEALSYPIIASQNEGFLRPNAGLRLIFLSDENDQSREAVQTYVDYFRGLKANPQQVIISAIVGNPQTGCGEVVRQSAPEAPAAGPAITCPEQFCGRAIGGDRYVEAVEQTGGVFGSICSCNFIEALQSIAYETIHLADTFLLTQTPRPDTVEVFVDDTPATGWRYDDEINGIVFEDPLSVPLNGSRIRVEYDLEAFCED